MKTNNIILTAGYLFKRFLNIRFILPLAGVLAILIFLSGKLERKTSENSAIFFAQDSLQISLSIEETKEQAELISALFMKNKYGKEEDLLRLKQICKKQIYFLETSAGALAYKTCEDSEIMEKYRKEIKLLISKNREIIESLEKEIGGKRAEKLDLISLQTDEVISFIEEENRKFDRIVKMYKLFN